MPPSTDDRESIKAGLKQWWSNFTKSGKLGGATTASGGNASPSGLLSSVSVSTGLGRHHSAGVASSQPSTSVIPSSKERKTGASDRVFGEPLRTSLRYASVAISMAGEDGKQYVWGYVPIIMAKTGLFLKENATEIEGVFRIAGSQKRMRQLQEIFDTPPKYGKDLKWDKYSVHDGASVLRRYLNQMPEPIVPLHLYNEFRNVMIKQPVNVDGAVKTYRLLIASMPPANRYLLLYVLDLLAVFARKSEKNLMPASNLAVIFQPGIFSHPSHLQDANEHKVAVEVLQFLIEHQDNFVLAISPPPPTNVERSELTSVSQPAGELQPDVTELSDSDEEVEGFTVHEGGGAKLARRSTMSEGKPEKRRLGIFRFKGGAGGAGSSSKANHASTAAVGTVEENAEAEDEGVVQDLGVGKKREPITPQGEIHEVGISNGVEKNDEPRIVPGIRRSKTVPSRKNRSKDEQRSVSAKVPQTDATIEEAAQTAEEKDKAADTGSKEAVDSSTPSAQVVEGSVAGQDTIADAGKPTQVGEVLDPQTGLPTPPSSKHIDQPPGSRDSEAAVAATTGEAAAGTQPTT